MKKFTNTIASLTAMALFTGLALSFYACSNNSPVASSKLNNQKHGELQFIELGNEMPTLNKGSGSILSTKWFTREDDDELKIDWESGDDVPVKVQMSMKVEKQSLSKSAELMLHLYDLQYFTGTFDQTSSSSDIYLEKNSVLKMVVSGADLSQFSDDEIDIYVENAETGEWQKASRKEVKIDRPAGKVEIVEAVIPNFTRFTLVKNDAEVVTKYVTYENGAELQIDYKGSKHGGGNEEVRTTFKVFSHSISEDAYLTLSMNKGLLNGTIDATFKPHGITFSKDAELSIEAKNIDLSGVDASTVGLYYVSDGQWVKMQADKIIVKIDEGYLKIDKTKIPHFSRYAVAFGE